MANFNYTLRYFPEGRDPVHVVVKKPLECQKRPDILPGYNKAGTSFFIDWKHVGLHLEVLELGIDKPQEIVYFNFT